MLAVKSTTKCPPVILEVAWHGASWRDVPKPEPVGPTVITAAEMHDGVRLETPEGLYVSWEPPAVPHKCFGSPGCQKRGHYRVYLVTGAVVAGYYCATCSRRVLVREQRAFLNKRALRHARLNGAAPRRYRRRLESPVDDSNSLFGIW